MLRLSRSPYLLYVVTLAVFAVVAVPVVVKLVLRPGHGFLPGGEALAWEGPLVVLHVSADLLIGVAYVVIAFTLVRLARFSGGAIPFIWAFVAFGLFIVACGLTHMAAALTVWEPVWWLAGGVKYVTAAVSVAMAVAAPLLLPQVLDVANGAREAERERRERAEAAWAAAEREAAALSTLNRVARLLSAELDPARLLRSVVDAGMELTGASSGAFRDPSGGRSGPLAVSGAASLATVRRPPGHDAASVGPDPNGGRSGGNGERTRGAIGPAASDAGAAGFARPPASAIEVPVVSRSGEVLGTLVFGHETEGAFGERENELAVGLAAHAAIALDNARLYAEARAGQELLGAAFDSASGGMALVGLDGRWLRVNAALCGILGYPEDELLRLTFREVTHPDDVETGLGLAERLLASEIPAYQLEKRYLRQDGHVVWVLLSVGLVRGDGGAPLHFVAQIQDVTGRKEAEAERGRLAAIVESAEDAIVGRDLEGTITSWNRGAERLFGYAAEEAVGRSVAMLAPPELVGEIDGLLAAVRKGEQVEGHETERVTKDGRRVDVSVTISPVRDASGQPVGASVIARDIGERKRLEQLRRDFLAMVTHDLRTPLTTVRVGAQLLQRHSRYHPAAVVGIVEQADRMGRLIDDLADVVRLEAGRLELRRSTVDLVALARREATAAQSGGARIQVEAPAGPVVGTWDGDRLAQILANLLGNATRYSPEGGTVTVTVRDDGGLARVRVRDEGPGIAPEHLPRLFERFYRADATGAGGLGLGLYISRMIAEAHGGAITAESEPGGGGSFTVTLPFSDPVPEVRHGAA